ncbi:efflux RND transporter permease subunit [Sediminispirochaeta bajacaliforniensis]|uniref:efflux RND transporter permease subunit n=1 Tax=Sediminispirochaeta bajacaliforniensis TaxID=148 RepID=UPI00035CFC2B|nr:efflux RND transporter permease subunit [Sediminispirochaeta bajacaliforniensis]
MEADNSPKSLHPKRKLFLLITLMLLSLIFSRSIDLGYLPETGMKAISVQIEYKGVFQEQIERLITSPLENELQSIPGIKRISSVCEQESATITIFFHDTAQLDRSYLLVRDVTERLYASLPEGVQRPVLLKSDMKSRPVFILAVDYDQDISEEELRTRFENVEGTGRVEIGGAPQKEVQIRFSPWLLAHCGLTLSDLNNALGSWNLIRSWNVANHLPAIVDSRVRSISDIAQLPVGRNLRMGDVADISLDQTPRKSLALFNGKASILVSVSKAGDANSVRLCAGLREASKAIPNATIVYDHGAHIESALRQVAINIGIGILAVSLLTMLILKRAAPALLICLNIPFSLVITIAGLKVFGFSLDIMTLSGLAVGTGMVIDAGVVFVEDESHYSRYSILVSGISTISVFLPLIFAPHSLQTAYAGIALSISMMITASMLYVFFILPDLLASMEGDKGKQVKIEEKSSPMKGHAIISRIRLPVIIALPLICLAVFYLAAGMQIQESDPAEQESFRFYLEFPPGVNLDMVQSRASGPLSRISSIAGVKFFSATLKPERVEASIHLVPGGDHYSVRSAIQNVTRAIPEAFLYFPEKGDEDQSLSIITTGPETERLKAINADLARRIQAELGYDDIVFHYKEVLPTNYLSFDSDYLTLSSTLPISIYNYLFSSLSGPVTGKWYTPLLPQGYADIRFFASQAGGYSTKQLLSMTVPLGNGNYTRVDSIATLDKRQETGNIYHFGRERSATMSVSVPRDAIKDAIEHLRLLSDASDYPTGYRSYVAPYYLETARQQQQLILVLVLSTACVFIVLMFHFEKITSTLLCMLQIPLSFSLPLIYFFLSHRAVDSAALIGLILVGGIAVNNGVLVLNELKGIEKNGRTIGLALRKKSPSIIISSLTTIAGIIPLLFKGNQSQAILASFSLTIALGVGASMLFLYLSFFALFPISHRPTSHRR